METDRTTATTANKLSRMVPSSGWHQQQEGSRRGRQLGAPAARTTAAAAIAIATPTAPLVVKPVSQAAVATTGAFPYNP